jgi:hypothetical protein
MMFYRNIPAGQSGGTVKLMAHTSHADEIGPVSHFGQLLCDMAPKKGYI